MSTKDFQAGQIRSSRWIASGSDSTQPALMIYSASAASDYIGGVDATLLSTVGTDVFVFFSGSKSSRPGIPGGQAHHRNNVALFGGDVVVSGTLFAEHTVIEVDGNVTGSMMVSGSLFVSQSADIMEGLKVNLSYESGDENTFAVYSGRGTDPSLEVRTADNGSVYINGGGNAGIDFLVSGDSYRHLLFIDSSEDVIVVGGEAVVTTDWGSDTTVLLSGTIGSKDGTSGGTTVVAGDLYVSGTTYLPSSTIDMHCVSATYSPAGQRWIKVASATSSDQISSATTFLITLCGKLGPAAAYQAYVTAIAKRGSGADGPEKCLVDIINSPESSSGWTKDHFAITSDASAPYDYELWVYSPEQYNDCFAERIGGPSLTTYTVPWELLENQSWQTNPVSLGATVFAEYTDRTFEDVIAYRMLVMSGASPTNLTEGSGGHALFEVRGDGSTSQVLILSGAGSAQSDHQSSYADLAFFVSGAIGSRGTTQKGTSVFGGDTVVSGASHHIGQGVYVSGNGSTSGQIRLYNNTSFPTIQISGSTSQLPRLAYRVGGGTSPEASSQVWQMYMSNSNGGMLFTSLNDGGSSQYVLVDRDRVSSPSRYKSILHYSASTVSEGQSSLLLLSSSTASGGDSPNPLKFTDTNFWVSGTVGSKNSTTHKGTAVFGGDVVTSGTLYGAQGTGVLGTVGGGSIPTLYMLSDDGGIGIRSNANLERSVFLLADGGTDSQVYIKNETGTGTGHAGGNESGGGSIRMHSVAGGIEMDAAGEIGMTAGAAFYVSAGASSQITTDAGTLTLEGQTGVIIQEAGTAVITISDAKDVTVQTSDDGSYGSADFRVNGYTQLEGGIGTGGGHVVINEPGGAYDFRVESDTHPHMLFVDASENAILIGDKASFDSNTPRDLVHIRQGDYEKSAALRIEHLMDNGETFTNSGSIIFSSLNSTDGTTRTNLAEVGVEPLGNLVLSASKQDTDIIFRVNEGGTTKELLRLSGSTVLILSGGATTSVDESAGLDVAFYVSGSTGNKDSATHRGTSIFGGDVVISGTLYDGAGALVGGGGWSDDGTVVRLTTSTDNVGIGTDFTSPAIVKAKRPNFQVNGSTILGSDEYGAAYAPSVYGSGSLNVRWLPEDESKGRGTRLFVERGGAASSGSLIFKQASTWASVNGAGLIQEHVVGPTGDDFVIFNSGTSGIVFIKPGTAGGESSETFRTLAAEAGTVFNENAQNYDFRVETSDRTHALYADASTNQVFILSGSGGAGAEVNEAAYTDLAFFVSGTVGSRGTSTKGTAVFGGDVFISGTLATAGGVIGGGGGGDAVGWFTGSGGPPGEGEGAGWISTTGSLSVSGSSLNVSQYIRHIGNTTTSIQFSDDEIRFNGANSDGTTNQLLQLNSTPSAGQPAIMFNGNADDFDFGVLGRTTGKFSLLISGTAGSSKYPNAMANDTNVWISGSQVLILSGGSGQSVDESVGNDVTFYVSGSRNKMGSYGTSVFGGDLFTSGVLYAYGSDSGLPAAAIGNVEGAPGLGNDAHIWISGSAGSRGTSTRGTAIFGGDVFISGGVVIGKPPSAADDGSLQDFIVNSKDSQGIIYVNGAQNYIQFQTNDSSGPLFPGQDTFFHVSGTVGGKSSGSGVAVFDGDVVISGTLHGGSPLKIGTDAHLVAANGATQYLYFGASAAGTGYGLRSNAGTLQFKNNGGAWADLDSGGGGSLSVQSGSTSVGSVTTLNLDMLGSVMSLGGGAVALTGTIGAAEDGAYSDGLFTSFSTSTPIGTAIDKINEVLKYLSPSPSPDLDDVNSLKTGVTTLLAFGSSNTVTNYTSVADSAGVGAAVDVAGSYAVLTSSNNIRLATFNGSTHITGVLNADITADTYSNEIINYSGSTFGDAETGTLTLSVNGSTIKTVNLTDAAVGAGAPGAGTGNQLSNNGTGFFALSQTGSAYQSNGQAFGLFQNRTGKFAVAPIDQRNGWNYARVTHTVGSKTNTTNYIEWVNDASGSALQVHDARFDSGSTAAINLTGSVSLSGVKYAVSAGGTYKATINNFYDHVYALNPIVFGNTNCTIATQTVPDVAGSGADTKIIALTGSFETSETEMLGSTIGSNISLSHPLKTAISTSGSITSPRFLIFSASNASTALAETFDREIYRLISGTYPNQSTTGSSAWDSTIHMSASNVGYVDGLSFYNNRLYSPLNTLNGGNFLSTVNGGSYFGLGCSYDNNPNYSTLPDGTRTFFRAFVNSTGNPVRDFDITITGGSSTIVPLSTALNSGRVRVHAKIPGSTGFLDLGSSFTFMTASEYSGGRIGSLDASIDGGGAVNHFSFGIMAVPNNGHVIVKIEADDDWTGYLEGMTVNFPAVGITAVAEAPNVRDVSCNDTGVDANLSFGSSHSVGSYTNVGTTAGLSAVDCNGLYQVSSNSGNLRRGIFAGGTVIDGIVNDATTADGNAFPANAFGSAITGTLSLEVNGSTLASRDLYDFTLGTGGNTTIVNGNGSGFTSVSEATTGQDGSSLPDYRRWYRTANWTVATSDQRQGWNYAKVIHSITGTNYTSNYVEWVNDDDSNSMGVDSPVFETYFGDNLYYYQSGVKYFIDPTGSFEYRVTHGYSNIFSDSSSALSLTSLSNLTTTRMEASGSGITDTGANATSMAMPDLLTAVSDSQTLPLFVSGNVTFGRSESLPGTWGSTGYSATARGTAVHPINGTVNSSTVTKTNFLVFSASLTDGVHTSNINTAEVFGREDFRLISGTYPNQSTTGSSGWVSTKSLEAGGAGYNTGLLIYNSRVCSPSGSNLPNHGNFKDTADGGTLTSAASNVDYTTLTNSTRDYYRAFKNNTSSDQANVSITLYGDATFVPRTGAGADTLGANKNFHVDVKIPGKTGWMDAAKAASGGISDGDGSLAGDRDGNVDGSGATNTADFQTQFIAGTASGGGPEHFMLRIVADKQWTGYVSKIVVSY